MKLTTVMAIVGIPILLIFLIFWAIGPDNAVRGNHNLGAAYEGSTRALAIGAQEGARCTSVAHRITLDANTPSVTLHDCFGMDWSIYRSAGGSMTGAANGGAPRSFNAEGPVSFGIRRPNALTQATFHWTGGPPVVLTYSYQ